MGGEGASVRRPLASQRSCATFGRHRDGAAVIQAGTAVVAGSEEEREGALHVVAGEAEVRLARLSLRIVLLKQQISAQRFSRPW